MKAINMPQPLRNSLDVYRKAILEAVAVYTYAIFPGKDGLPVNIQAVRFCK